VSIEKATDKIAIQVENLQVVDTVPAVDLTTRKHPYLIIFLALSLNNELVRNKVKQTG